MVEVLSVFYFTQVLQNGWGDYPLGAVFVRTEIRSVNEAVTRIKNNQYILAPDFQRDFVWSPAKQSS